MGETYIEQLIKQKMTTATLFKIAGLLLAEVASIGVVVLFIPQFFILPLLVLFGVIFFIKRISCVEFEYIYCNGEVDIDRILGMESRKRFVSIDARKMEILAPVGASALAPYKDLKVYDCSTNTGAHAYEVVTERKGKKVRIIFEPNKEILDGLRLYAPRKVLW